MVVRTMLVRQGRDPFQVLILAGCALAAVALTTVGVTPTALRTLPGPLILAWEVMLAFGGGAGLLGTWWRGNLSTALLVQSGGILMVACMITYYVASAFWLNGASAIVGGLLLGSIAGGCWWRFLQLVVDLRRLDTGTAQGPVGDAEMVVLDSDDRHPYRTDAGTE